MAWVAPVTNRTSADLTARNSKAFFNVADWTRIDGNISVVAAQILSYMGTTVTLNSLTTPDISTIPAVEDINDLVENIDRLRLAAGIPAAAGMVALTYDYVAGAAATAPDYTTVNAWENDLDLMYTLLPLSSSYYISCGVAAAGQSTLWQARFRG